MYIKRRLLSPDCESVSDSVSVTCVSMRLSIVRFRSAGSCEHGGSTGSAPLRTTPIRSAGSRQHSGSEHSSFWFVLFLFLMMAHVFVIRVTSMWSGRILGVIETAVFPNQFYQLFNAVTAGAGT